MKILDFFCVIDNVVTLLKTKEDESRKSISDPAEVSQRNNLSPLLKHLMSNAEKNVQKMPKQRRHNELLKKFATSLLIFAGPLSYEFVHQNMPEALPSLRSVQRIVLNDYQPFHEGEFRFDELKKHLSSYKAPMVVTIGEDATRLVKRVMIPKRTDWLGLCYHVMQEDCHSMILLLLFPLKQCKMRFKMPRLPTMLSCLWPSLSVMVCLHFVWHVLVQTTNSRLT